MRVILNLATRPFADLGPALKRLRIAMGILVLVSGLLALGLHFFHQRAEDARARDHSLDGRIAAIQQERQNYQQMMQQPANAQLLAQVAVLNRLFEEKTFSWTLAMEDLETVLPGGVQVSTLEPVRAKNGTITLRLRVTGPRDRAVELVANLEHSKYFLLPRIVGENAESSGAPGERVEPVSASNRVNFDLLADYNPAAAAEHKPSHKQEGASAIAAEAPVAPAQPAAPVPGFRRPPGFGQRPMGAAPVRRPFQPVQPVPQPIPGDQP
jgi:type IV pilus assembly protein PilN